MRPVNNVLITYSTYIHEHDSLHKLHETVNADVLHMLCIRHKGETEISIGRDLGYNADISFNSRQKQKAD